MKTTHLPPPQELSERRKNIQRNIVWQLLCWISESAWQEHLVLRGSLLLLAWLGSEAREPEDIDWMVRPEKSRTHDLKPEALLQYLTGMAVASSVVGDATIIASQIRMEPIWSYDKAPGSRFFFPWTTDDALSGVVQMDIVFDEDLLEEPMLTEVYGVFVWTATLEVSLAWKLLWLQSYNGPEAKDLYDATLLAETVSLRPQLLHQALLADPNYKHNQESFWEDFDDMYWGMDWSGFQSRNPQVKGDERQWQKRLMAALEPTIKEWDKRQR